MKNAVRVDHENGSTWVTDATSIATYGRREATLQISGSLSPADVQRIGSAYIAGKKDPSLSIQASPVLGPVAGVDYGVGDWVTVAGTEQRCVDIRHRLDRDNGDWQPPEPVFSSLPNERGRDADRAFDRLLSAQGGGAVDASVSPAAQLAAVEAVKPLRQYTWSWYDGADPGSRTILDDDSRWQVETIQEPCRAGVLWLEPDFTGATGDTTFELHLNGSNWSSFFNLTIPSTPVGGITFAWVQMWGYSFLNAGDKITVRCTANGQHRQGKYTLYLFPSR